MRPGPGSFIMMIISPRSRPRACGSLLTAGPFARKLRCVVTSRNMSVLDIEPVELAFRDVRFATAYTCNVRITNTLNGSVECQIKAGASDRYSISPSGQVRLGPRESAELTIRLKVLKFANRKKAIEGHRDVFHIKVRACMLGSDSRVDWLKRLVAVYPGCFLRSEVLFHLLPSPRCPRAFRKAAPPSSQQCPDRKQLTPSLPAQPPRSLFNC